MKITSHQKDKKSLIILGRSYFKMSPNWSEIANNYIIIMLRRFKQFIKGLVL